MILDISPTQTLRGVEENEISTFSFPAITAENEPDSLDLIYEIIGKKHARVMDKVFELCGQRSVETEDEANSNGFFNGGDGNFVDSLDGADEVIEIVKTGDPKNRIDVVFMGDGYTIDERTLFIDDIKRLTEEMFVGETFSAVLPFFNIWAVFRPSRDSGITANGVSKNTAFGLYREKSELRGIYVGNPSAVRNACKKVGPFACDYPSIIANDPLYGGLGGEFVISTSSKTSGTVVLRHEMGHNFITVGEEYDGGYVYSGVNSARGINGIKWAHWLSKSANLTAQRNALLLQDYSWWDLNKGSYSVKFSSNGKFNRWLLKISASGVEMDDSLIVSLDGKRLDWKTNGLVDRSFYDWYGTEGFTKGQHVLEFHQGFPANRTVPLRQLCSITLHEFGNEEDYTFDDSVISAFPTYDIRNRLSYRPTNEGCLMRNMTHKSFCSVCQEGMFLSFLSKVSLIDDLKLACKDKNNWFAELQLIPLAQFRKGKNTFSEKYHVAWLQNGVEVTALRDRTSAELGPGKWAVNVRFETNQVRKDEKGLLKAERKFEIRAETC